VSQVIAEARRLGFLSVRGNHDDAALAAYEAMENSESLPRKRAWVEQMPQADAEWLRQLPFSIRVPSYGIVIVHAGIVPDVKSLPVPASTSPQKEVYRFVNYCANGFSCNYDASQDVCR